MATAAAAIAGATPRGGIPLQCRAIQPRPFAAAQVEDAPRAGPQEDDW
jgi:hypothetical protein